MQHQQVLRYGGADAMALRAADAPTPSSGQVRVHVELAGVALSDILMRQGRYPGGPVPPYTPGWDVVGTVDAIGSDVEPNLVGRRVAGLTFQGGYATAALVDAALVVGLPASLAGGDAAALTLNYVTAWQMLTRRADAAAGQHLLVRGAGGGVGTAALDIGRHLGLRTWGAASSAKRGTVEAFGAVWIASDDEETVARQIGGFDIILDPLGGRETWRAVRNLARGGIAVSYGFTAMNISALRGRLAVQIAAMRLRSLLPDGQRASFFRLSRSATADPQAWRADLAILCALADTGRLAPLVADVLPLSASADAHHRLESRTVEGKLLLDPTINR